MEHVVNGDFIEIDYTGRIKLDNKLFDTTTEAIAKKEKIYSKQAEYGPIVICIGKLHVIRGLDDQLKNKKLNKDYSFEVDAEQGFGKKDPKLMKIVSMSLFKKQKMNPYPGLQINANGRIGTVRSITGGRVLLDFNHQLAGRDLVYEVRINKKINDSKKKVESILRFGFMLSKKFCDINLKNNKLVLEVKIKLPKDISEKIITEIKNSIPEIKEVNIKEKITTPE